MDACVWLLCMFVFLMNDKMQSKAVKNSRNDAVFCDKIRFNGVYRKTGKMDNITSLAETCSSLVDSCDDRTSSWAVEYQIDRPSKKPFFYLRPVSLKPGCWGYLLEVYQHKKKIISEYKPYEKNGTEPSMKHLFTLSNPYEFHITPVPFGKAVKIEIPMAPSKCELEGMAIAYKSMTLNFEHCVDPPNALELQNVTSKVCNHFHNETEKVKTFLTQNPLEEEKCVVKFYEFAPAKKSTSSHSDTNMRILLGSMSGVLLLAIVFMAACIIRLKNRKKTSRTVQLTTVEEGVQCAGNTEKTKSLIGREVTPNCPPKVMILNRPGCEYLDLLLRDLAFILKSYGIDVKLTLLEQNNLDAEGGISSYLQRNIDTCNYILILFTDSPQDRVYPKHRPYEFAVKVISGLAFHQNDCSRYLPLYLTSYDDAIKLLPTFLVATQDFGFKIPKDVSSLIKKLLGPNLQPKSKARDVKNNFFLNRIKSTCKKIEQRRHQNCNKEDCYKGTQFGSVSNLSSIWASTIYSKWPSFHSFEALEEEMPNSPIEEEMEPFVTAENWVISSPPVTDILNDFDSVGDLNQPQTMIGS